MEPFNIMSVRSRLRGVSGSADPSPAAAVLSKAFADLIDVVREESSGRAMECPCCSNPKSETAEEAPGVSTVRCGDGKIRRQIELWSVLYSDDDGPYVASYATKAEADRFNYDNGGDGTVVNHYVNLP